MEWQHKAANNFNGFPMRLQTLGVARAGHSTSTLNWLHSSLSSHTPPPRFLLCSFIGAAACECLSQSGREKKDEAEATPMPCECCGTVWMRSECEWVWLWMCMWTGMVSGQPEMHCFTRNFIRVFIMPSVAQCGEKKCQKQHFINAKVIKIINEEYRRGAAQVSAVFRVQFPKDSTAIPHNSWNVSQVESKAYLLLP